MTNKTQGHDHGSDPLAAPPELDGHAEVDDHGNCLPQGTAVQYGERAERQRRSQRLTATRCALKKLEPRARRQGAVSKAASSTSVAGGCETAETYQDPDRPERPVVRTKRKQLSQKVKRPKTKAMAEQQKEFARLTRTTNKAKRKREEGLARAELALRTATLVENVARWSQPPPFDTIHQSPPLYLEEAFTEWTRQKEVAAQVPAVIEKVWGRTHMNMVLQTPDMNRPLNEEPSAELLRAMRLFPSQFPQLHTRPYERVARKIYKGQPW